jgi:hypothetical protein
MPSKNLTWVILALCGSVLTVASPIVTQAADQPVKQITTSDAKQDTLMCRDLDIPGSHVKHHICGTAEQWSDVRNRLTWLRDSPAASITSSPPQPYMSTQPNTTFQRH